MEPTDPYQFIRQSILEFQGYLPNYPLYRFKATYTHWVAAKH